MEYESFLKVSKTEFNFEVQRWKSSWASSENMAKTAIDALKKCKKNFFPTVYTLLTILVTLPVTSVEAERSFSTMRRVKNYLRNSMSQERLTGLCLLNIHRDIDISFDEIANKFVRQKNRRLDIAID